MKNGTRRILAVMAAFIMASGGLFAVAMSSEDTAAASYSYQLYSMPDLVELRRGDTLTIDDTLYSTSPSADVNNVMNAVPWLSRTVTPILTEPITYRHRMTGNAEYGTFSFNIGSGPGLRLKTIDVFDTVTFSLDGFVTSQKTYGTVQLPNPETRPNYTLQWWTAQSGGLYIGDAGQIITVTATQTMFGRWVQTTAFATPSTDNVYVHYLDSMTYTVNPTPPNATISAYWMDPTTNQAFSVNNNTKTISIDKMELVSGTYEMRITVTAPGMNSSYVTLNVNVYPHEIRNLDPASLGFWSYTVSTNNPGDTMSLIQATQTVAGVTTTISNSSVQIDNVNRTVGFTFATVGVYEFALKITSPAGTNNTLVLRIMATDTVVSVPPSINDITVINNGKGNFDFVLINPQNYVSILWDFGDGTSNLNQYISRNYTYNDPGVYTLTVILSNNAVPVQTATITKTINNMQPITPPDAYRNVNYVAVVQVAAANAGQVKVDCPDWMNWEFISAGGTNYVLIQGMFTDVTMVSQLHALTVTSNGNTDKTWNVNLAPAPTDSLVPDFQFEWVNGYTIRMKYTGSSDAATRIYVQWVTGGGYSPYLVTTDGWMYHEYTSAGTFTITVSAVRLGVEATVSKIITINAGGSGPGTPGENGPPIIPLNITNVVLASVLVLLTIIGIAAYSGRPFIAGISFIILLAIAALWLVI